MSPQDVRGCVHIDMYLYTYTYATMYIYREREKKKRERYPSICSHIPVILVRTCRMPIIRDTLSECSRHDERYMVSTGASHEIWHSESSVFHPWSNTEAGFGGHPTQDRYFLIYGCAKNPTWQVSDEQICPLVFSLGFNLMLSLQSQHKVLKVPSLFTVIL